MDYQNIPVVLVVAGKKINYIPHVIKNLSNHCEFNKFYVICPEKDIDRAAAKVSGLKIDIAIVNEESIVQGLNLGEVRKNLTLSLPGWPEHHLAGWYYQQFLKIGFSRYAPNYDHYLIWDADTLLTRPVSFFDDETILLTQGNEFHKEYFQTIRLLLGGIKTQDVSHISQHLMVKTEDMLQLIEQLEISGMNWWAKILASLKGNTPFQFSEYETYANFCLSRKSDAYHSIERKWFRYGKSYFRCDLTEVDVSKLSKHYEFVAFEDWDSGVLKSIRAQALIALRRLRLFLRK